MGTDVAYFLKLSEKAELAAPTTFYQDGSDDGAVKETVHF